MASDAATVPLCMIDGRPATAEAMLPAATSNYGHITIMQVRGGRVRGFHHHLRRLDQANMALFGRGLDPRRLAEFVVAATEARPDATLRINIFGGDAEEHVMVTAFAPAEHDPAPARFSLVPFERDMPHLKHVGSFGLSLRQRQAVTAGFDGAVFVDRHGRVSEATIWNVGFRDGDAAVWPDAPHLAGITQIIINEGFAALGVPVRYEDVRADALGRYGGAFLTNSSTFGRPLAAIGSHSFALDPEWDALLVRAYELTPWEHPHA